MVKCAEASEEELSHPTSLLVAGTDYIFRLKFSGKKCVERFVYK
jgi:hypothetical protein